MVDKNDFFIVDLSGVAPGSGSFHLGGAEAEPVVFLPSVLAPEAVPPP